MSMKLQKSIAKRTEHHGQAAWCDDLEASRDVSKSDKIAYAFLLHWFESWRLQHGLKAGVEEARRFWALVVKSKKREAWSRIAPASHAIIGKREE